jgi:predicted aspartyl protease
LAPKHPDFRALRLGPANGRLSVLITDAWVCSAFDPASTPAANRPPMMPFKGLWDTGATGCVVTQNVVNACGLKAYTMRKMKGAYGAVTDREAYLVNLRLLNGVEIPNTTVTHGDLQGFDILLGMDIITLGDFAITNEGGNTLFSFRIPSCHTIDYVKQANQLVAARTPAQGGSPVNPAMRNRGRHHK